MHYSFIIIPKLHVAPHIPFSDAFINDIFTSMLWSKLKIN